MSDHTGIFIAVPDDIADHILKDGYRCTRRRRVPASHNREAAIRAYKRSQRSRPPRLLEVTRLPVGTDITPHKDGIKLSIPTLPANFLKVAPRSNSTSASSGGMYMFESMPAPYSFNPAERTGSLRPELYFTMPVDSNRGRKLSGRRNVRVLYHCTQRSNAQNIIDEGYFRPGRGGFLGPGIYFSESPGNARRYCQCRSGYGGRVVLHVEIDLGNLWTVPKNIWTRNDLTNNGYDAFKEQARDCYMLPDDTLQQINMDSVYITQF